MTSEPEQSNVAESAVGGHKQGGKYLVWTQAMDDFLIDIMLEMVKNNQFHNGVFRPGTYNEMERQLNLLEPGCGVRVNPHISSRLKTLKRKFNGVKELRGLSGAGWNEALKQVELEPIIYNEYVKNRKVCKGLNRVPIARYDDLATIYGNSSATGKGARGINDPVPNEDDLLDIDKELDDEGSMHCEFDAAIEVGEELEKEVQESEATAPEKEKGQASVSSKPKNKRRRVAEAEVESTSVGKELLAELKPMMEVFIASLGDALRVEAVVEQEPMHDELARMRNGIQEELEKLDGLTSIEKIKEALILVDSVPKLELFYRQKDDNRELFVKCLLGQL